MANDTSETPFNIPSSNHFTRAMLRILELAVSLSLEKMGPSEIRQRISDNANLIEEGIQDATTAPISSDAEFEEILALIDTIKAIVPRSLIARRSAFDSLSEPPSNTVLVSASHPSHIRDYFSCLTETAAILSLCLRRDGMVSAFIAQYYPPDEVEYTRLPLVIGPEGQLFNQLLEAYATSLSRSEPDTRILGTLLDALARALTYYFGNHSFPNNLVIIPHRLLHIIPWHMLRLPTRTGLQYLPVLTKTIAYASSLRDLLSSNVWAPTARQTNASVEWVAVIDESAEDLPNIILESRTFRLYKKLGASLEIVNTYSALPIHLDGVSLITWSGHSKTNPFRWGGSYLRLGRERITAEEIMAKWVLRASPTVMLSSCESAIDISSLAHSDEYCGLDMAFRIAGARSACGTVWPVSDHTAAVVSVLMVGLLTERRKSAAEALTFVQRGLITGTWQQWRPSRAEVERLTETNHDLRDDLVRLHEALYDADRMAFADPREWASFRCLGA